METMGRREPRWWSSRPHFKPRQLLTAKQLLGGFDDELMRQRLLNRAVHGYGVVIGLGLVLDEHGKLDLEGGCITLTGGLALDRHGRMLHWTKGPIGIHDIVGPRPDCAGVYTLCAHFATRPPQTDGCLPFAGDQAQWWKDGVVFSLQPGCHAVDCTCPDHPKGACISHDHYLSRRTGGLPGANSRDVAESEDVHWLSQDVDPPRCPTGFDHWVYDPDPEVGVPLACLQICDLANPHPHGEKPGGAEPGEAASKCDPRYGFCESTRDETRVRPFVYRNPLLYDLVNGCDVDLPQVRRISWQNWIDRGWQEDQVQWSEFAARIASTTEGEGFEIWFTRPIRIATIHPASIFMTVLRQEPRADYWISRRLPTHPRPLEVVGAFASGVRLEPDSDSDSEADEDWLTAEVTGKRSSLFGGVRIEVTVRGQLLRDQCNQMLDARPVDIPAGARGQAMPGGDVVSVFVVGAKGKPAAADAPAAESRIPSEGEEE